jgi:fructose-1,6-bisphosphatase/sedoheptulose 1,7-bisphosphatase-like protein
MSEAEKWSERVQEFKESGKSQRVWCAEKGIKRSSLRYWLERLDELSDGEEVIFAEIDVTGGTDI